MSLTTSWAHGSFIADIEQHFDTPVRWAEMLKPQVQIILFFDGIALEQELVLHEARDILEQLETRYTRVSFVFREQGILFIRPKPYGLQWIEGKVSLSSEEILTEDINLVKIAERLYQTQREHAHE